MIARTALAAGALLLAGCTGDQDPGLQPAEPSSSTGTSEPTDSSTPRSDASSTPSAAPVDPAPTPSSVTLSWKDAGRPAQEPLTAGYAWTLDVDEERALATLDGPGGGRAITVSADKRFRVEHALLDGGWAVVVLGDTLRELPARATVVNLGTGRRTVLDGTADPPTVSGGTWALSGGLLVHATQGRDDAYCLASRDLATRGPESRGATVFCAPDRHGFTNARISSSDVGLMTFDDARPSCRTLGTIGDGALQPLEEATPCKGWEVVVTESGPVWTEIPREKALDEARVFARVGDTTVDLGGATSGSLTWCAGAAYFARDPQSSGEPARLLRWTEAGDLEVVYESDRGSDAFIDRPRCGGDRLTISVFAESGDQQLTAPVP